MKRFSIVFIILLVLTPFLVAQAQSPVPKTDFGSVEEISDTVQEKTPSFIKKPFLVVYDFLEGFRTKWLEKIKTRQTETKATIKASPEGEVEPDEAMVEQLADKETSGMWHEVKNNFKYLEIFVLALLVFIFSVKWIFYSLIAFVILTIIRFFWLQIY